MAKLTFETAMKALVLINKMNIDLDIEFDNMQDFANKILTQTLNRLPSASDEFLAVMGELCGKEFTRQSDFVEMVADIKANGTEIIQAFQSALKLKNAIS